MPQNDRCPRCGAMVLPEENYCPQCGAALKEAGARLPAEADGGEWQSAAATQAGDPGEERHEDPEGWQPGTVPQTIGQLRAFCEYNGMPLEKMRFFVGVDYRQPRAFGIYREGDRFVVYKNKADGSRAVRYQGPDEAHAVGELYAKLLDECHQRDIWPDGKPADLEQRRKRARIASIALTAAVIIVIAVISFFLIRADRREHAHDGYYRFGDDRLYYRYGTSWYYDDYYDGYYGWWLLNEADNPDAYEDHYLGRDYDSGWGASDFRESDAWESIQEEHRTSSSDYSSWDSGGTDWNSDW